MVQNNLTFDDWFISLTEEEQQDYVDELNAEYWIDQYKENYY